MPDLSPIRKLSAEAREFTGNFNDGLESTDLIRRLANLLDRLTDEGALERGARALLQQAFTPRGLTVTDEDWLALKDGTIAGLSAALNALLAENGQ